MRLAMDRRSSFVTRPPRVVVPPVGAVGLLLLAGLCSAWLTGCASRSPDRQDFVEVRTENFVVTSSLGSEKTLEFVLSLEYFHAGLNVLLGRQDESTPFAPTPVYVFDDRSPSRPFAVRNQAAYLIDEVEAPVLVFRAGRDFEARATPALRQRYAQRMLRDRAPVERPLWFEEGVSQLARSMDETSRGSRVGAVVPEFKREVLDWRQGELVASLNRFDLSEETRPGRERFSARAWAIAHTLEFEGRPAATTRTRLDAYRSALDAGGAGSVDRALAATGLDAKGLQTAIYAHLENRRPKVRLVKLRGFDERRWSVAPLSRGESNARLGELALRIGKPELALRYFDVALKSEPANSRARIARAMAAEGTRRFDDVEAIFEGLPASAEGAVDDSSARSAEHHVAAADVELERARSSASEKERRAALERAREHYDQGLRGATPSARAQLGMARTYLEVEGEDPAGAIPWLEAARKTRRGSLELELWQARAEARMGDPRLAGIRLRNVVSRTHDLDQEAEARTLLDSLGQGAR